jgi:hypothetical protein
VRRLGNCSLRRLKRLLLVLYLLHPCSRKESIQKPIRWERIGTPKAHEVQAPGRRESAGGPLPLKSCAPRFHRGLPEGAILGPLATRGLLAAPLRAESLDTSLCLVLRMLSMQIGCPADLSRRKLRCSARQTGPSPYHCKCLLLNRVGLTVGLILTNRKLL